MSLPHGTAGNPHPHRSTAACPLLDRRPCGSQRLFRRGNQRSLGGIPADRQRRFQGLDRVSTATGIDECLAEMRFNSPSRIRAAMRIRRSPRRVTIHDAECLIEHLLRFRQPPRDAIELAEMAERTGKCRFITALAGVRN
ncbi:MAG: hypothetical protein M3440_15025, partial [Chloroflexota bacterium]|nr:hypothetical protein [Chloroflexota bacterium]